MSNPFKPDPAAALGVAISLSKLGESKVYRENISDTYAGGDEFMRQCMRVGELFETWACDHVDFEALDDVWPYMMQDKFADAAKSAGFDPLNLREINGDAECLEIAKALKLTLRPTVSHTRTLEILRCVEKSSSWPIDITPNEVSMLSDLAEAEGDEIILTTLGEMELEEFDAPQQETD